MSNLFQLLQAPQPPHHVFILLLKHTNLPCLAPNYFQIALVRPLVFLPIRSVIETDTTAFCYNGSQGSSAVYVFKQNTEKNGGIYPHMVNGMCINQSCDSTVQNKYKC